MSLLFVVPQCVCYEQKLVQWCMCTMGCVLLYYTGFILTKPAHCKFNHLSLFQQTLWPHVIAWETLMCHNSTSLLTLPLIQMLSTALQKRAVSIILMMRDDHYSGEAISGIQYIVPTSPSRAQHELFLPISATHGTSCGSCLHQETDILLNLAEVLAS